MFYSVSYEIFSPLILILHWAIFMLVINCRNIFTWVQWYNVCALANVQVLSDFECSMAANIRVLILSRLGLRVSLPICWGRWSSRSCGNRKTWWGRWLCCTCQYHCPSSQIFCEEAWVEEVLEEAAAPAGDDRSGHDDGPGAECRDHCRWWRRSSCSKSGAAAGSGITDKVKPY